MLKNKFREVVNVVIVNLRAILAIAWINGLLPIYRIPLWLIHSLIGPISIFILVSIFSYDYLGYAIIGGLVMTIASNGFAIIGDATYYRVELKFQHLLIATPISPITYTIGLAISELVYSIPGIILFVLLALMNSYLNSKNYLVWFFTLTLLWLTICCYGYTLSTYIHDVRYTWAIAGILGYVTSVIVPVYYPLTIYPLPDIIAIIVPTSACSLIIQHVSNLVKYSQDVLNLCMISLIAQCILSIVLAMFKSKWRTVK